MEILKGTNKLKKKYNNLCIALGTFDGIHLGHKEVINSAIKESKRINGTSMILTFNPHPLEAIRADEAPKLINTYEEKLHILEDMGVDVVLFLNFNYDLLNISAKDFLEKILVEKLEVKELFIGFNFNFGKGGQGDSDFLISQESKFLYRTNVISPIKYEGEVISSTRIRESIFRGDLEKSKKLLGYNFMISGKVISGKKIGRELGFPTANIIPVNKVQPPYGVYGVRVHIGNQEFDGLLNMGINPTIKHGDYSAEVFIFNFNRNIYNEIIIIELLEFLRREKKFKNREELVKEIKKDIKLWEEKIKCR